jgi:hypothetical protein
MTWDSLRVRLPLYYSIRNVKRVRSELKRRILKLRILRRKLRIRRHVPVLVSLLNLLKLKEVIEYAIP